MPCGKNWSVFRGFGAHRPATPRRQIHEVRTLRGELRIDPAPRAGVAIRRSSSFRQ